MIQNPETAQYPGMPQAVAPSIVDLIANLEDIGPLLVDLVTKTTRLTPSQDQRLRQLLEQLRARTGLDFHHYKAPTIQRRLLHRMAATGQLTLAEYLRYLQQHPAEYQQLAASFMIKVIDFFRDPELFAALQQRLLPELIARAREQGQELRLWSAGCATGEEAYSLAILVAELLREEREQWRMSASLPPMSTPRPSPLPGGASIRLRP
jgi:two-component system CheB/CheR fusion protein